MPLALSDVAVMHALMCLSGVQYTSICAQNPKLSKYDSEKRAMPPLYLLHKRQALLAIQKRLKDPSEAESDGTVAAITLLAGYEVSS
jgi:hypothetical protein